MKTSINAAAILLSAACLGCDKKSDTKPVEVNAPGVQVNVDPQDGVKVKAPGVEIETK
jgi:hypothetical protein